jgi:enterochelin esterase-like enzyme
MRVYTPPQFAKDKHYPVLYLLHGSLGDETSWVKDGRADAIFDNLHADKKLVPMIVVMPDVNLPVTPDADLFELDLLGDVVPYVENHYPVKADRTHRALAGVSAGANRALSIGLAHPDAFAYIGVFIGGLLDHEQFEKKHEDALTSLQTDQRSTLLWLASGRKDIFYENCQDTLRFLDKHKIHYVYVEGKGLHNWETTRNDLFVFAPLLFHDID